MKFVDAIVLFFYSTLQYILLFTIEEYNTKKIMPFKLKINPNSKFNNTAKIAGAVLLKKIRDRMNSTIKMFNSSEERRSSLKSNFEKLKEKYNREPPNFVPKNDLSFFPYKKIQEKDYKKIMDLVTSNAVSKTSLPYSHILINIMSLFSKEESKNIKREIERIRKLSIESATDEIIKFSDAIKTAKDEKTYWYYYLITAQAVLKGRLTETKNSTEFRTEKWRMPDEIHPQNQVQVETDLKNEINNRMNDSLNNENNIFFDKNKNNKKDKQETLNRRRILEINEDPNYDELFERDAEFEAHYISALREYTLYQIRSKMRTPLKARNPLDSIYRYKKRISRINPLKGNKKNKTNTDSNTHFKKRPESIMERFDFQKKKETYDEVIVGPPNFREWKGDLDRKQIKLGDFEPNIFLYNHIKNTKFYKLLADFPKGVIHHLHWSAAFYMGDIMRVLERFTKMEFVFHRLTVLVKADIYLEDKTIPQSYFDIPSPKILIILNFELVLKKFKENHLYSDEKQFRLNYILADGRCVLNPIGNPEKIDSDVKAFFFLRLCRNSVLYTNQVKDFPDLDFFKNVKIMDLSELSIFLQKKSHILDDYQNLQEDYLPNSYKNLLYNIKDQLSVAVWFKFEMIFGIYSELFDNMEVFTALCEFLTEDLVNDKVMGVEFRQGYDAHKSKTGKSKINELKRLYIDKPNNKTFPVSFILPGRKMKDGHKLRNLIEDLNQAKKNNDTSVVGFDFFGYEDDPFTGARNFFPLSIKNMNHKVSNDKKQNINPADKKNEETDFLLMLNALRDGYKIYLHAGETLYFPNYPVSTLFFEKFYINDNLIHAALLPNVERIGHGFAVADNELLMNIYKKKGISLEICPTSNQALHYYDVDKNPIVKLLRKGLSVTVSPDDPGLFFYSGVRMDWFNLFMSTDLKISEYYLLIRNSILKSSIKEILENKDTLLKQAKDDILNFFVSEKIESVVNVWNKLKQDNKEELRLLQISKNEKLIRIEIGNKKKLFLEKNLNRNGNRVFVKNNNPYINIYNIKEIIGSKEQTILRKTMKKTPKPKLDKQENPLN